MTAELGDQHARFARNGRIAASAPPWAATIKCVRSRLSEDVLSDIEKACGELPTDLRALFQFAVNAPIARTVGQAAAAIGKSERGLVRTCVNFRVPRPKKWLVLADALKLESAWDILPTAPSSLIAAELGYADKFGLSRALRDATGFGLKEFRLGVENSLLVRNWLMRGLPVLDSSSKSPSSHGIDPIRVHGGSESG